MACSTERSRQLARFAAGRLDRDAVTELLDHVGECADCSGELDLVADLVRVGRSAGDSTVAAPLLQLRALRWTLVAAAVLAAVLIWQLSGRSGPEELARLASVGPLPAVSGQLRGDDERGEEYRRAIDAYASGDFEGAAAGLTRFVAGRDEDALAHLYLGVAQLTLLKLDDATPALKVAAEHGEGLVQEHALWFLGNAWLLANEPARAVAAFEQLLRIDGDYAMNAEDILRRLGEAGYR